MTPRSLAVCGRGLAAVGAGAGLAGAAGFVHGSPGALAFGLAAHLLAVAAVAVAARCCGARPSELRLLATMSAGLPGVGAVLAAGHLVAGPAAATNAHAAHVESPFAPEPARRELADELRVTGYATLLREGSLEQKRNLLRRLASLGEPRHLGIVRRFLADPEPELRLCAYAELAAVAQRHEARIGALQRRVEAAGDEAAAADVIALAEQLFAHATSGALDDEMARYWLARAEQVARRAASLAADLGAQRVLAAALAAAGRVDAAWAVAATWPEQGLPPALELTRAEIAFRRRDRIPCEHARAQLEAAGVPVPAWLRAAATAEVLA